MDYIADYLLPKIRRSMRMRFGTWIEHPVDFLRYEVTERLRRLRFWIPVIWKHPDADWIFYGVLTQHRERLGRRLILTDNPKDEKQVKIGLDLLNRILEQGPYHASSTYSYLRQSMKRYGDQANPSLRSILMMERMKKRDEEYLSDIIGKDLQNW